MDFQKALEALASAVPQLVVFLVALKWVLDEKRAAAVDAKDLQKLLISNGLTDSIKRLTDSVSLLPDRVGQAVALKILESNLSK